MNSVATAVGAAALFLGAIFMLVPRWLFGAGDTGSAAVIFLAAAPGGAGVVPVQCGSRPTCSAPTTRARAVHGSVAYAVATGWGYGAAHGRSACAAWRATLSGVVAHRMVFGINTLLVLVIVRHTGSANVAGLGTAVLFASQRRASAVVPRQLPDPAPRSAAGAGIATVNGALAAGGAHPARARSACTCR